MGERIMVTGNYSAAYGSKLSRAQVVAAYPITPQTTVVEKIAEFVSEGYMDTKYIKVESEHSAMAACIAASNTGARAFTATSAHGLALMHELLMWACGARTPIVMANVNRAMGPPWSVWADHQDSVAQRDTGWIQFYAESNQEVLDMIIQCYKVAEDPDVMLPAMVNEDAFFLSHTYEAVELPDQELVDEFLPPFEPKEKLDIDDPKGFGSLVMPEQYYEFRYKIAQAMDNARHKIRKVDKEFKEKFGRGYGGLVEFYKCDDAEVALIVAGTAASTAKEVVDYERAQGRKVGLARIRAFRPFPYEEMRILAKRIPIIGVIDRSITFGFGGAMFAEVKSAIYNSEHSPAIKDYFTGIGGRDITPAVVTIIIDDLYNVAENGLDKEIVYVDVIGGDL